MLLALYRLPRMLVQCCNHVYKCVEPAVIIYDTASIPNGRVRPLRVPRSPHARTRRRMRTPSWRSKVHTLTSDLHRAMIRRAHAHVPCQALSA